MTNDDAIKWLENLKNDLGNPHYERLWHYAQAIDEICELLEKEEPIAPTIEQEMNEYTSDIEQIYFCGACRYAVHKSEKYCANCGKAVKWDAAD